MGKISLEPVYTREGIVLYCGDCRDFLPLILEESVDLLLTDPPYGNNYVTNRLSSSSTRRNTFTGNVWSVVEEVVPQLDIVLQPNSHIYMFSDPRRIGNTIELLQPLFRVKNILCWDKGNSGTAGDLVCGYGQNWEAIVYANKGRRPLNRPRPRAIIRFPWSSNRDPVHPTVKPVEVLKKLILSSTQPGDLVLDPFAGSATTLAAALLTGRQAIGIELDKGFVEVAISRLQQL